MQFDVSWLTMAIGGGLVFLRILSQAEWWQRKEYRWDRVRSQLSVAEGQGLLTPLLGAALGTVFLGWLGVAVDLPLVAGASGAVCLLLLVGYDARWIVQRGIRRPRPTVKATVLVIATMLVMGSLAWLFLVFDELLALRLATLVLAVVPVTALAALLINIPIRWVAQSIIARAKQQRAGLTGLRVIGITGSYGKTSTKFFLQQLLAGDSQVLATADHRNSPLVVAQDMQQRLKPTHTTYIVEMGAYRRGEIRELCELTQPQIGLITAIGNQHVALFGSAEAVATAKWELIDSLPASGIAVLNADDPVMVARAQNIPQRIIWFSLRADHVTPPDVFVSGIAEQAQQLDVTLHINALAQEVRISLIGRSLLASAVAAAAGALAIGTAPEVIFRLIQKLQPFPRTMAYHRNTRGVGIIDDSYSGNEYGARLAIEHLRHFSEPKKIIVFTPFIELGSETARAHEEIGEALARSGATVLLTNATHQAVIVRGGRKIDPRFTPRCLTTPRQLAAALLLEASSGSVVLLEGRLPEIVRQKIMA